MKLKKLGLILSVAVLVCGCGKSQENTKKDIVTEADADAVANLSLDDTETTEATQPAAETETEETVVYPEITSDEKVEDYDSVVVVGDAAYELYSYKEDTARNYADAVNSFADSLGGQANLYDMVIPLSSGITFPDNLKDQIKSSDQKKAIEDILAMMGSGVNTVNIYDALMSHRDEYIYFRTDHHWTPLGAYYAYQQLCQSMGIEAEDLDSYQTQTFDGFLGSFYNDTDSVALKNSPDTITAYVPNMTNTTTEVTPSEGDKYSWQVIFDVTDYPADVKYSTFIAGDNPFTEITNEDITDGSSCVVIKESFGNAFVPFLVDHYSKVYVVDYRYYTDSLSSLIKDKGVQDVILLNNLSMIRNQYLVGQLESVLTK